MRHEGATHRTTIEIEVLVFESARAVLGTTGYEETVNEALRAVSRGEHLRRGATQIRAGRLDVITPEELRQQRSPRF
jgi:hypothetical protein